MTNIISTKDGRLHIYVRQDKYKGKLKSENWVGRTFHNGKQKVISSGTTDLEEAKLILEKWYDDLISGKLDENSDNNEDINPSLQNDMTNQEVTDTKKEINQTTEEPTNQEQSKNLSDTSNTSIQEQKKKLFGLDLSSLKNLSSLKEKFSLKKKRNWQRRNTKKERFSKF